MKTRGFVIVCSVAMIMSGLVSSVAAEKGDMQVRFGLLYSMPTDDYVDGAEVTELDSALGFQAGFEYHVTDRIGVEPGVSTTSFDFTDTFPGFPTENGDTSLFALTANVNYHFEQDSGLDLFVGPTIGFAFWDDVKLDNFDPEPTDDELLFGVNFGLDYPIGDGPWDFHAGMSYVVLDLPTTVADIGVSPIQVRVGMTYDF